MGVQLHQRILSQDLSLQGLVGTFGDEGEVQVSTVAANAIPIELRWQLEVQWMVELSIGSDGDISRRLGHQTQVIHALDLRILAVEAAALHLDHHDVLIVPSGHMLRSYLLDAEVPRLRHANVTPGEVALLTFP